MAFVTCDECNGKCCRDVSIELDEPEKFEDFETVKWFLAHKNVTVYIDNEGEWLVEFKTECKFLNKDSTCKIYNDRYSICKDHKPEECMINGSGKHYKKLFRNAEDIDKYIKEIGAYEEYSIKKKKSAAKN